MTIAVPIYNMERWLEKNLETYRDKKLYNRLEVICVNNASVDSSKSIVTKFCLETPEIFHLIDREIDDYGAAINDAISFASGTYFRIVDSDDWVDTNELIKQVDKLEACEVDAVLTDYQLVNMRTGAMQPVYAGDKGIEYYRTYTTLEAPQKTLPSIHTTTYRTALLKENRFFMQNGIFYTDEEYVVLPFLHVKTILYFPYDIYRYQVANPQQSMSPMNRAKLYLHREKVLRRLISEYYIAQRNNVKPQAIAYCKARINLGVGDHFTTLYIYIKERKKGRMCAKQWKTFLQSEAPEFWVYVRRKVRALYLLNIFHISLPQYDKLKAQLLRLKWFIAFFKAS
nr:glycosyltransferase family 2 protein [Butyricicoccus faecihominis]